MNYVLLIHAAESRFATMSPSETESLMQEYGKYTKDLFATGKAGDCAALEPTHTATHVQVRDGKRIVKDGPFAETREQLGGYYAIAAKTEEEAIDWAAKIPDARGGTIEVRPIPSFDSGPATPYAPEGKGLKQYLLLIYEPESRWENIPEAEAGAIYGRYMAFSKSLKEQKKFIAGDRLVTVKKAKSVGVTDGKRVLRDGPFAETREQLGGYYRVFAKDLDEAIAMAAQIPAAETGTIEVRPIADTSAYA